MRNRAQLSSATEPNFLPHPHHNKAKRSRARERRFAQEQKKLFSSLLLLSIPFQHKPQSASEHLDAGKTKQAQAPKGCSEKLCCFQKKVSRILYHSRRVKKGMLLL
jgi:hypothetical protein